MTVIVYRHNGLVEKWYDIAWIEERPQGMVCLYRAREKRPALQLAVIKLEVI